MVAARMGRWRAGQAAAVAKSDEVVARQDRRRRVDLAAARLAEAAEFQEAVHPVRAAGLAAVRVAAAPDVAVAEVAAVDLTLLRRRRWRLHLTLLWRRRRWWRLHLTLLRRRRWRLHLTAAVAEGWWRLHLTLLWRRRWRRLHLTLLWRGWWRLHLTLLWRRRWWLHLTLLWRRWRRLHLTLLWRRGGGCT